MIRDSDGVWFDPDTLYGPPLPVYLCTAHGWFEGSRCPACDETVEREAEWRASWAGK